MTAKKWCQKFNLIATVNAGMFQTDGLKNVGYMKNFHNVNNGKINSYKAMVVFNPITGKVPEIQVVDREFQDFHKIATKYQTGIQNIRMITSKGENVWSQQDRKYGMVALGQDKKGDILFLFHKIPIFCSRIY